jgi:hypothetical protein
VNGNTPESWLNRQKRNKNMSKASRPTALSVAIQMQSLDWRTQQANEAGAKVETLYTKDGQPARLGSQAQAWATPNTRDHKDNGTTQPPSIGQTRGFSLGQQMVTTSTPGKLNPRWVETLMGLPVGWTMPSCASLVTIASTNSDSSATELSQPPQPELF